jgi:hypothetical protein
MKEATRKLIENGLRGHPLENLIDGWVFHIDEPSSNVYKVEGTNRQGKNISSFGMDPEMVLSECLKRAERLNSRQRFFIKIKNLFFK